MKQVILSKFDSLMSHLNSEENGMAEEFRGQLEKLFDSKLLYILISNGGDGSYYPHYTTNSDYIAHLNDRDERGELDYEDLGCDGDGFHYDTLQIPAYLTVKDLGDEDLADGWVPGQDEEDEE